MFFNYGAFSAPPTTPGLRSNAQNAWSRQSTTGVTTPSVTSNAPTSLSLRSTPSVTTPGVTTPGVTVKVAAKNNADAAATVAEVRTARTPAERNALQNKLVAQQLATAAAVNVGKALAKGDPRAVEASLVAQKKAEIAKQKAEARASAEAEKAQKKAEEQAKGRGTDSSSTAQARASAVRLAPYIGKRITSARNGRVYEVYVVGSYPAIGIYYPDGRKETVRVTDPTFSVVFEDLQNAAAVAALRAEVVVATTGSATGDVVTLLDIETPVSAPTFTPSTSADVAVPVVTTPALADIPFASTPPTTTSSDGSAPTTTSSGGSGTMRVTEMTSSDFNLLPLDTFPESADAALTSEMQTLADEGLMEGGMLPAEVTTVSLSETVPAPQQSFLSKYKWPITGFVVFAGIAFLNRK